MFCEKCGARNEDWSSFCQQCGVALTKAAADGTERSTDLTRLRHPKESLYLTFALVVGVLCWLAVIWIVVLFAWVAVPVLIMLWLVDKVMQTKLLGNSVKVYQDQYPDIFKIVQEQCTAIGLRKVPEVFVYNSEGGINAFAVKILKARYVILLSGLVDALLTHDSLKELSSIVGHEIGHHAAGHTAVWKTLLIRPAMFIPFFGPAYSRSCELTADRIGTYLCGDKDAACRGLITLACGSRYLSPKTSVSAFRKQEEMLSPVLAFLNDLWSTHPRITKRVIEIENVSRLLPG